MSELDGVHYPTLRSQLPTMAGKTVCITGTTSGTGYVAAHTVASLGAKVLLLNRKSKRSAASGAALREAFRQAEIHDVECDLQSFASVEEAATRVEELSPEGVHVLCNNAGVMALPDQATTDGFDVQMQTNHLSHFLLTRELMPLLERAAEADGEARVVNHSSSARMFPKRHLLPAYFEARGGELGGDGNALLGNLFLGPRWLRYNQSKLANCAFTAALHHRLQERGSNVKALVAHPGLASTNLQKTSVKQGGMGETFTRWFMKMSQTPADGALGIISCMCLPSAESGQFYGPGKMGTKGPAVSFDLEGFYDTEAQRELLWTKSEEAIDRPFAL